jgi:hypothetical protein
MDINPTKTLIIPLIYDSKINRNNGFNIPCVGYILKRWIPI